MNSSGASGSAAPPQLSVRPRCALDRSGHPCVQRTYGSAPIPTTVSGSGSTTLVVDNWSDHGPAETSGTITLTAGVRYDIRTEYYEKAGSALVQLLVKPVTAKTDHPGRTSHTRPRTSDSTGRLTPLPGSGSLTTRTAPEAMDVPHPRPSRADAPPGCRALSGASGDGGQATSSGVCGRCWPGAVRWGRCAVVGVSRRPNRW